MSELEWERQVDLIIRNFEYTQGRAFSVLDLDSILLVHWSEAGGPHRHRHCHPNRTTIAKLVPRLGTLHMAPHPTTSPHPCPSLPNSHPPIPNKSYLGG